MIPIQILLLLFLLMAFILYWKVFQNRFLNRLLLAGAFLLMGLLVLYPSLSTYIANRLGVGRGTDLILYVCIVCLMFVLLLMYSKIKKLEEMITALIRDKALKESEHGDA